MLNERGSSRRTFVGGAVAGAVAIGAMGLMRLGDAAGIGEQGVTVIDGKAVVIPGFVPNVAEIGAWEQAIGTSIGLSAIGFAATATLVTIVRDQVRGKRPAGVRQQPFTAYFSVEHRDMPATDGLFMLAQPIEGLSQVFLMRGEDRLGKGSLVAIFN